MDRLVRFLTTSVLDRQQRVVKGDDTTLELQTIDGTRVVRFTTDRELATNRDDVDLLGLDHSIIQQELTRWQSLAPEELGISVQSGLDEPMLLASWLVESLSGTGERRLVVQSIAVTAEGTRVPSAERQADHRFFLAPANAVFSPAERRTLFANAVEPTLQRELQYKGASNGDGSYSATLIGYIESL